VRGTVLYGPRDIAALMATTYSTATIASQSKPLAIQKVAAATSFSHSGLNREDSQRFVDERGCRG
jgi:hypothetical protein